MTEIRQQKKSYKILTPTVDFVATSGIIPTILRKGTRLHFPSYLWNNNL